MYVREEILTSKSSCWTEFRGILHRSSPSIRVNAYPHISFCIVVKDIGHIAFHVVVTLGWAHCHLRVTPITTITRDLHYSSAGQHGATAVNQHRHEGTEPMNRYVATYYYHIRRWRMTYRVSTRSPQPLVFNSGVDLLVRPIRRSTRLAGIFLPRRHDVVGPQPC